MDFISENKKKIATYNIVNDANMHLIVWENLIDKCWVFFDSRTEKYTTLPFAQIAIDRINIVVSSPEELLKIPGVTEQMIADKENYYKSMLDKFKTLDTCIRNINELTLEEKFVVYNFFKFCSSSNWKKIIEKQDDNSYNSQLYALEESSKKDFTFSDYDMINTTAGSSIARVFYASEPTDVFQEDLYKVLFDKSVLIKSCNECGHLFIADNNKAVRCKDCRKYVNTPETVKRRYAHRKIQELLLKSGNDKECDKFVKESNYYWYELTGSMPKQLSYDEHGNKKYVKSKRKPYKLSSYIENINMKQYEEWLNKKYNAYSDLTNK